MIDTIPALEGREAYVSPDVARTGTVEELTKGTVFTDAPGDITSFD